MMLPVVLLLVALEGVEVVVPSLGDGCGGCYGCSFSSHSDAACLLAHRRWTVSVAFIG